MPSGLDLEEPGRVALGLRGPGGGLWGGGWGAVSALPLLLLDESTLSAWPLFWGVPEWVRDSWLPRSGSLGSLLALSSWVWIRAAGRGRVERRWPEGWGAHSGGLAWEHHDFQQRGLYTRWMPADT